LITCQYGKFLMMRVRVPYGPFRQANWFDKVVQLDVIKLSNRNVIVRCSIVSIFWVKFDFLDSSHYDMKVISNVF